MNYVLILAGYLTLIASSYIDNVRGPLLPTFQKLFELKYTELSGILIVGHIAAIVINFLLFRLYRKHSEKKVNMGIVLGSLAVIFYAPFVDGKTDLYILGFLVGLVIGSLGSLCNILVIRGCSPENQTRYLSGLHAMYGLGSLSAPLLFGYFSQWNFDWWQLFLGFSPVILILVLVSLIKTPYETEKDNESKGEKISLNLKQFILLLSISFYVGAEVMASMWMVSFLQNIKGYSLLQATQLSTVFFTIMMVLRILAAFFLKPQYESHAKWGTLVVAATFFLIGRHVWTPAIVGTGFIGVFFPLILGQISKEYPEQQRSLMVWVIIFMQGALIACHFLVGLLSDRLGLEVAYYAPVVLVIGALSTLFAYEQISPPPTQPQLASKS